MAYFNNGELYQSDAMGNVRAVYYPVDDKDSSLIVMDYTETDTMRMYLEARKMQKIWTNKAEGTWYPMTQIPPSKRHLDNFAWFDYIRPVDKTDIFVWRGKKAGTELKSIPRHEAPLQKLPLAANIPNPPDDESVPSAAPPPVSP